MSHWYKLTRRLWLLTWLCGCGEARSSQPMAARWMHVAQQQPALLGPLVAAGRMVLPMMWSGNVGLHSGQGSLVLEVIYRGSGQDFTDQLQAPSKLGAILGSSLQLCGVHVPVYQGAGVVEGEQFGTDYPEALFDNQALVASLQGNLWALGLGVDSNARHGKRVSWGSGIDTDHDGLMGITVMPKQGNGFNLMPTGLGSSQRAQSLHVGNYFAVVLYNLKVGGNGRYQGMLRPSVDAGKLAFFSHLYSCSLNTTGECSQFDVGVMNRFAPQMYMSGPGTLQLYVPSTEVTCSSVRASNVSRLGKL